MRAQRAVLREIADRNLNPNVAYIAGKDGQLREKKPSIENSVPAVTLSVESIKTIEVVVEQVSTVDQAATETFVEEIPLSTVSPQVLFSISGLSGMRGTNLSNLFQDVIVHASQSIIDGASTVLTLENDIVENCSICQDRMRQGELIRTLTACTHKFHQSCVDNWLLERSVRCPECRHDIREPMANE